MRRPIALLAGLALALAGAEAGVRAGRVELRLLEPLVPRQVFEPELHTALPDPELLYGLRPGLSLRLPPACPWSEAERVIHTNSLGFRGPERSIEKAPDTYRILAVGSSHTFGPCVSDGETWPAQLEAELNRQAVRPVEVWNLGVSGYMTRQAAALAARWAPKVDADLVLLQVYNVGRRFLHVDQPLAEALAVDPGLWSEYLDFAPTPTSPGARLFERSGLYRFGVVALNRALWGHPERDPLAHRIAASRAADEAAMRAIPPGVRVIVLIPPPGAEAPEWGQVIDLSAAELGAAPDAREIHPGADGYRNVAKIVASHARMFGHYQR